MVEQVQDAQSREPGQRTGCFPSASGMGWPDAGERGVGDVGNTGAWQMGWAPKLLEDTAKLVCHRCLEASGMGTKRP